MANKNKHEEKEKIEAKPENKTGTKKVDPNSVEGKLEAIKNNFRMQELIDDPDWRIRLEIAKKGFGFDKLVNDENHIIRKEVASHGCFLVKLSNDEDPEVRAEVAKWGVKLSRLISDEEWVVRTEVAKQGYGIDKLINDKNKFVVSAASKYLKTNKLSLEEWEELNPDKRYFDAETGEEGIEIPSYEDAMKEMNKVDDETVRLIIKNYQAIKDPNVIVDDNTIEFTEIEDEEENGNKFLNGLTYVLCGSLVVLLIVIIFFVLKFKGIL